MKIHKQGLTLQEHQTLIMPLDAKVLSIQVQCDQPCVWYMFTDEMRTGPRRFIRLHTGQEYAPPYTGAMVHRGTVVLDNGSYVAHFFEHIP